ncbi:RloB-like protein [Trichlorobacter thiogenes]|uniref:RloB-like protein n=2 Tax=Trichlorobacter thiogenes TaxID=115783 RepID=A0A1T4RBB1_9BACT|nr:RloB-like protein [Trichlorobacter thiogenes]
MMSKPPKAPSLKRKQNIILPKIEIYVLCEGKVTEPDYIEKFSKKHINKLVKVFPIKGVGVPLTVVEEAVALKRKLLIKARKKGDSYRRAFCVWSVMDIDDHPNIPAAINLALNNKIHICISNPCFEIWPFLHLKDHDAYIHRDDLHRRLNKEMPQYHHEDNPTVDYDLIADNYEIAKCRAIRINKRRHEEDNDRGNPTTDVYNLLDCIINMTLPH